MARILMQRHRLAPYLVPASTEAEEEMKKLKPGQAVLVEVKRARSPQQLRLWWALMGVIFEHQETYPTREAVSDAFKCWLGHCDELRLKDGRTAVKPKSIAFGNLPQAEWEQLFDAAIKLVCDRVIPGTTDADLRRHLEDMVGIPQDDGRAG